MNVQHRQGRPSASEAGFTLVEALIAMVVLIFGLMAVSNLLIAASASNTVGSHATAAAAIASERMERLKATPFLTLPTGGSLTADTTMSDASNAFSDDVIPGVGTIHTRWTIVAVDGQTRFIRVRSESSSPLAGARSRADFTTFRSCTATTTGCPNP